MSLKINETFNARYTSKARHSIITNIPFVIRNSFHQIRQIRLQSESTGVIGTLNQMNQFEIKHLLN